MDAAIAVVTVAPDTTPADPPADSPTPPPARKRVGWSREVRTAWVEDKNGRRFSFSSVSRGENLVYGLAANGAIGYDEVPGLLALVRELYADASSA